MGRVLLFGEPLALFTARELGPLDEARSFDLSLAGAELNVAIGLTRLGHEATYLSCVGDDALGRFVCRSMEAQGVSTSSVALDGAHPTGLMLKGRALEGDPEIAYHRAGSAFSQLEPTILDDVDFRAFDLVHLTGIPCALGPGCLATTGVILEKASVAGVPVSFDPNLRPQLWPDEDTMAATLDVIARACQMVLPGLGEGRLLAASKGEAADGSAEAVARHFLEAGVACVAVKLGAEGAYLATADGGRMVEGFAVPEVVDTVGAGDGFAVGFISGVLEGLSPVDAVRRGNAIGALQVMTLGDTEGLPTRDKLAAFMGEA